MEIEIPFNFTPRSYQEGILKALDSGILRAVWVVHRRGGKDKTMLNYMIKRMLERVGVYYYFLPTYAQGRKIIWDGIDGDGFRFIDHFPAQLVEQRNDQEMKIRLYNGSLFQVIGTDKYDSIVGTNPVGCVFSEYSLQNPMAWEFIRPILSENGGWASFIYTPRGKNHGFDLYDMARNNPNWYCELLTVNDTNSIKPEVIEEERASGMDEEMVQQEYYCSFEAGIQGAFYTKQIKDAEAEGRIANVPHEVSQPVITVWDLGIADATAIWFAQMIGQEIRLIDYEEYQGEGMADIVADLRRKPYNYNRTFFPHDGDVRELGTGRSRREMAESLGLRPISIVPNIGVADGINAARTIFNRCWFDKERCRNGLNALRSYHKEYDEKNKTFRLHPHHDWASHGADAFRYLALALKQQPDQKVKIHKYR